jgi:hypothetical protein
MAIRARRSSSVTSVVELLVVTVSAVLLDWLTDARAKHSPAYLNQVKRELRSEEE